MGFAPAPRCVATVGKFAVPNLATWFTPSLQVMQRSKGRSAVAAAAYRSCTHLHDERVDVQHDYRAKTGHVSTELFGVEGLELGPEHIGLLWNKAEHSENRKNSAVARELMVPLPSEWSDEQRRQCVRGLAEMLVARYGVAVMASIHRPAHGLNEHVHIMFTTREVDSQMNFGKKTRVLDDMKTGEVKALREEVCRVVNDHAKANKSNWYVYAGKFADVDETHIPTKHIPINAPQELRGAMEAENAAVVEARNQLHRIAHESKALTNELAMALEAIADKTNGTINTAKRKDPAPTTRAAPSPTVNIDTEIPISPLVKSLDIRHAYQEVTAAHARRKDVREVAKQWRSHLRELEAIAPSPLLLYVARAMRALGVRDTIKPYEDKLEKARLAIERCREADARLGAFITDPERKRKYQEWQQWPEHRQRVEAYEKTLPDAPRLNPRQSATSWDGPNTLTPQLLPVVPEPWN
jgi:MobA/MobL family